MATIKMIHEAEIKKLIRQLRARHSGLKSASYAHEAMARMDEIEKFIAALKTLLGAERRSDF